MKKSGCACWFLWPHVLPMLGNLNMETISVMPPDARYHMLHAFVSLHERPLCFLNATPTLALRLTDIITLIPLQWGFAAHATAAISSSAASLVANSAAAAQLVCMCDEIHLLPCHSTLPWGAMLHYGTCPWAMETGLRSGRTAVPVWTPTALSLRAKWYLPLAAYSQWMMSQGALVAWCCSGSSTGGPCCSCSASQPSSAYSSGCSPSPSTLLAEGACS